MHAKNILVACGKAMTPERVAALFSALDAHVRILKVPLDQALSSGMDFNVDLLVVDDLQGSCNVPLIENALCSKGHVSLFLLLDEANLDSVRLPGRVNADFACSGASDAEIKLRCRNLLWPGEMTADVDFVQQGQLTINLATYQVKVAGEPIDLTLMEYSLLAFLVTHPGRIYSREVLLSQVWGFDYYGGSRTVDVHVRRLRAKLGAEVAQRIETVRGVGYMWGN